MPDTTIVNNGRQWRLELHDFRRPRMIIKVF